MFSEIIDDLAEHSEMTDTRVTGETQNIQIIERKDRTCGM